MMVSEEWCQWEMSDFGFYQDLDDDHDHPTGVDSRSAPSITTTSSAVDDPQPTTLTTHPPLLTTPIIDQLTEYGLPWSLQDYKWVRLFASCRDGTAFGTFMRTARNVGNTIIVAKTSTGRVVGGYVADVWSGRKKQESGGGQDFLFCVDLPTIAAVDVMAGSASHHQQEEEELRVKRFIPGLEEIASSPRGVLDFDFESLSLSSDKVIDTTTTLEQRQVVQIFKPSSSSRQSCLKQVCQLGNKLISLGNDVNEEGDLHNNNMLTIENSFSKGQVTMASNDGTTRIMEEFEVVNFELYCLSDDDD